MKVVPYLEELLFEPPDIGSVLSLPGLPGAGARIYDRSPYGNHGTIVGATWKRLPSGLWGLAGGGDDYVNCGTGASLDLWTSSVTLLQWYKMTVALAWQYLVSRNYKYALGKNDADLPRAYFTDSGGVSHIAQSGEALLINTFYFLAAVYDRDNAASGTKILVNGILKATDTTNGNLESTAESLYIGVSSAALGDGFKGQIFLPRVISSALTGAQLLNIFNQERHLFGV